MSTFVLCYVIFSILFAAWVGYYKKEDPGSKLFLLAILVLVLAVILSVPYLGPTAA